MRTTIIAAAAGVFILGTLVHSALAGSAMTVATAKGGVLADSKGMSLYTFDKDMGGKSVCYGPCAVNWPPLMAKDEDEKGPAGFSVITRNDGSYQWAYKGKPLYLWIKDKKPGDMTGDGFKGVWHLARP